MRKPRPTELGLPKVTQLLCGIIQSWFRFGSGSRSHDFFTLPCHFPASDFRDGPVVKDLPCSAGDTGLVPGPGTKVSEAVEPRSLHATTAEPGCHVWRIRVPPGKILWDAMKILHTAAKT